MKLVIAALLLLCVQATFGQVMSPCEGPAPLVRALSTPSAVPTVILNDNLVTLSSNGLYMATAFTLNSTIGLYIVENTGRGATLNATFVGPTYETIKLMAFQPRTVATADPVYLATISHSSSDAESGIRFWRLDSGSSTMFAGSTTTPGLARCVLSRDSYLTHGVPPASSRAPLV
jgi:hypothetical protein